MVSSCIFSVICQWTAHFSTVPTLFLYVHIILWEFPTFFFIHIQCAYFYLEKCSVVYYVIQFYWKSTNKGGKLIQFFFQRKTVVLDLVDEEEVEEVEEIEELEADVTNKADQVDQRYPVGPWTILQLCNLFLVSLRCGLCTNSCIFICFSSKNTRIYYPSRYHLTAIYI